MTEFNHYMPFYQGVGTNLFSQLSTKTTKPAVDPFSSCVSMEKGKFRMEIKDFEKIDADFSVQTHKLFDALVLGLSAQNTYHSKKTPINTFVTIHLNDFITLCGKPRSKATKDETRKRVKKDLDLLYNASIEWKETRNGKEINYARMRICDRVGIEKGYIVVNFTLSMAEYLINAFVSMYPLALLSLDNRQSNAYYLGKKLAFHFGLRNNIAKGSNNCISVTALLAATPDIPDIKTIEEMDPGHWDRRIRQPLEKSLDILVNHGLLGNWRYCLSGKKEVDNLNGYTKIYTSYAKLYICFSMPDFPQKNRKSKSAATQSATAIT